MLTPRKSLNLEASVLRISALMLRELQKRGVVEFERLRALVVRRVGSDGEPVFLSAYHLKNDTLEFKADNNAN